ncbi:MAG: M50 family metallopeptidase [Rubrobacteraceae bacterium]
MRGTSFAQNWRRREILLVLGLALALVVLGNVPVLGTLFYPFRLFGTFVHELGHGLAAVLTGGHFQRFAVNPDLSGSALSSGGIRWIIASAGYVGSALFGGLLIILSARGVPARKVLLWLGIVLGVLCLLFVRNLFGVVTGLGLASALVFAGRRLDALWADGLLLLLAVQMMLGSLNSLLDLLQISVFSSTATDAALMAQATGIPAAFWALLWTATSGIILFYALRIAYRRPPVAASVELPHPPGSTSYP